MANNSMNETDKVVGVFMDQDHAQRAIQALKSAGYQANIADKSAIDAFRNSGFEDDIVELYRSRQNEGNSIVVVQGKKSGDDALRIMLENGAEYINLTSKQTAGNTAGAQGAQPASYYRNRNINQREYGDIDKTTGRRRDANQMKMVLRDETLNATKTQVQAGEVELRKVVHEKEEQIPVNLSHEEVYIERHAVDRPVAPGEITDAQDEVIRVPVYEEQAQLQKQARVREEVTLGKNAVQEQQTLTGTTRHEHAEIVKEGDVRVAGDDQGNIRDKTNTRDTDVNTTERTDRSNYNQ
ncbi:MAG: YsnF/AvaK domain-containing protein [Chloroflexota bacterium]